MFVALAVVMVAVVRQRGIQAKPALSGSQRAAEAGSRPREQADSTPAAVGDMPERARRTRAGTGRGSILGNLMPTDQITPALAAAVQSSAPALLVAAFGIGAAPPLVVLAHVSRGAIGRARGELMGTHARPGKSCWAWSDRAVGHDPHGQEQALGSLASGPFIRMIDSVEHPVQRRKA